MRQSRQKRCLAPARVMEAFHVEQLAVDGVVRLIERCAHRRHLRVFEHRIPPRFLVIYPVPHAFAVFLAFRRRGLVHKTAQSLPKRHYP